MRRTILLFVTLFTVMGVYAQSGSVTATVIDAATREGVPGAVVEFAPANTTAEKRYFTTGYRGRIEATVPYGTVVKTGSFVIVTRHPRATVSALTNTRNIWSFTVTAEDGVTTAVYTVTVNTAALPEPITPGVDNKKPASKPEVKLPFTDVSTSDWFYDDVRFANQNGLFNGVEKDLFAPEEPMTRGMLVTVLWRLDGETAPKTATTFTDVDANAYYADAVAWAAGSGIVNGVGGNKFAPSEPVTREQLAAIFFRYAKAEAPEADVLSGYPDAEAISTYARDAMAWAVSTGLVTGSKEADGTYLAPQGLAAREQAAAILMRYVQSAQA